ncbi:DUF2399 domain-containing protein [Allorhizocola rhizosphaerae]|uniref:DUF2399 domain-containing protein n=1 Tax=Allorhizocola rhizosphaerae TaxID=1872709 RepID=UPI001B8AF231
MSGRDVTRPAHIPSGRAARKGGVARPFHRGAATRIRRSASTPKPTRATASWDPQLQEALLRPGVRVHEELVLADLLADLAHPPTH